MIVNYARIAAAEAHYQAAGFQLVETPWIVNEPAYRATKPMGVLDFVTLGGYLVASGEHGFIQHLLEGRRLGRAVTTTPCFRHERRPDELRLPYFLKVELIDTEDTSDAGLERVMAAAEAFFGRFVRTKRILMADHSWDIVEARTGIELGSYGRRSLHGHRWLYGTGLAEPRLTQAITAAQEAA